MGNSFEDAWNRSWSEIGSAFGGCLPYAIVIGIALIVIFSLIPSC